MKIQDLSEVRPIYTLQQLNQSYDFVSFFLENLDEEGYAELFSGNEKDVDKLLNIITEETGKIIHSKGGKIHNSSFHYLDALTTNVDDTLRKYNLNYFIESTLPWFDVNWHHVEWGNLVQLHQYLCVLAARDHSKSTFFSRAYILWKLYRYNPLGIKEFKLSFFGLLVTSNMTLAKHLLTMIRDDIEENEILSKVLYRQSSREGWGAEYLKCKNGAEFMVRGVESRIRGLHPGFITTDDYISDNQIYSSDIRKKYIDLFHSVIMNAILPGGQVIVDGTPMQEEDIYGNLRKNPSWAYFEYPAIFPDGRILWSERYSYDDLMKKKLSLGNLVFGRELLFHPISSLSSIFSYKLIEKACQGMDKYSLVENIESFPIKFVRVVAGMDIARSASAAADYSAIITLGIDSLNQYWVLNVYHEKGRPYGEQLLRLRKIQNDFRCDIIYIENNQMQQFLVDGALAEGLPVEGFRTTAQNKYSLDKGLPSLALLFEQGRIKFPRGDSYSRNMTDVIASELLSMAWTDRGKLEGQGSNDDLVMSLHIACRAALHSSQVFSFGFI